MWSMVSKMADRSRRVGAETDCQLSRQVSVVSFTSCLEQLSAVMVKKNLLKCI